MPIKSELYTKVKETKTIEDFNKLFNEMSKSIDIEKEEDAREKITAVILAAGHVMIQKFAKCVDTRDKAGQIMWNFIRHWLPEFAFSPLRIIIYEDMLYPQFEKNFKTITPDVANWVKKQAQALLESRKDVSPELKSHWQSIVDGKLPYGIMLEEDFLKSKLPKKNEK